MRSSCVVVEFFCVCDVINSYVAKLQSGASAQLCTSLPSANDRGVFQGFTDFFWGGGAINL